MLALLGADAAASPSAAMDDATALRFFDERVRWQTLQFADAMRDVEVRCVCPRLSALATRALLCRRPAGA